MPLYEYTCRQCGHEFEALVRDFPDYATGHLSLGSLLAQEGHRDEAIRELETAHRLDPQDAAIRAALASARKGGK